MDVAGGRSSRVPTAPPGGIDRAILIRHLHPEDAERVLAAWDKAVETKAPFIAEFRVTSPAGTPRWVFVHAEHDGDEHYLGVAYEVTDRKRAELEFIAQERLYRRIVQSVAEAICILDQEGRISFANEPAAKLTGREMNDIVGRSIFEAVFPQDEKEARARFERRKAGAAERYQVRVRRQDGSAVWVDVASTPMYDDNGQFTGSLLLATDITERKEAEAELARQREALERSNTDLQQFAYVTSHDLQEPLRTINSYIQLLQARYSDRLDGQAVEFMGFITSSAQRMDQLIRDILSYSRVVKPDTSSRAEVDLTGVVQWSLMNLQHAVRETGAVVNYADLPVVWADRTALVQLFQNLLSNALKYRSEKTPVIDVFATELERGGWRLSIRDNGIGIAPQFHERIFGLFKRLHGHEYPGTGLGLAICQRIVEQHGGRIWVESAEGQGATFNFILPPA